MEQLDTTQGKRKLMEVGTGAFRQCGHPWKAGARADFKTCAQAASATDSVVKLGLVLQGSGDDPFWITCATGCCTGGDG
jgi:hypothetical protein